MGHDKHTNTLNSLEQRLRYHHARGRRFYKETPYNANGLNGIPDLLAVKGKWMDYYEVKSSYCTKNIQKAVYQFARAKKALPQYHWRFILVTPYKVQRFYL